jgi:nitrate reductase assembly molybdenum cofactor insertion protein NarJ
MVSMRQQIRALGIKETLELPDHLSNILPLLGRLQDAPAAELSRSFVLPALLKMEEALAGKQNPFADVLCAVRNVIEPKTTAGVAGLSCNDGLNGEETTHA